MRNFTGLGFDAVGVEHTLAQFFAGKIGQRGEIYDADIIRNGHVSDFGKIIEAVANRLEQRLKSVNFTSEEEERGGAKARIEAGINGLRTVSEEMMKEHGREKDDYHWMLVGSLIGCVDGLLLALGA